MKTFLSALQWVHRWCGIILCVPLVLIGITGSILVFDHEIEDLIGEGPPSARATGERRSFGDVVAAAQAVVPAGMTPSLVIMPEDPGRPASVRFALSRRDAAGGGSGAGRGAGGGARPDATSGNATPAGAAAPPAGAQIGPMGLGGPQQGPTVWIDPVSLEVLGQREGQSTGIVRTIHILHANLLIRDRTGREIVGWLGVVMLFFGLSGIVMWWPRPGEWRRAFIVRRKARGQRFHRELHGAVGIWTLLVFVVVSFSGVYIVFPQTLGAAVMAVMPSRDLRAQPKVEPVRGAPRLAVDDAVAMAREVAPGTSPILVAMPVRPDQPARVQLTREGHEHGKPMVTVFIDPAQRKIVEVRDPKDFSAGEAVMTWQRPLHAGRGLGWVWRILVFVSGFLPLLFVITGISFWWLKRRARIATETRRAAVLNPAE